MSGYELVTLRLRPDGEGGHHLGSEDVVACFLGNHWLKPGPHVVKVEPAPRELPTEFGALILTRANGEATLLTLGESDGEPAWFIAKATPFQVVQTDEIGDGWVRIDPGTLRPIEEPT